MEASANVPVGGRVNWGVVVRVGLIVGLILALVGYALKVTYESVIQGGVVNSGDYFTVELKQMSNFEMDQQNASVADVPERFRNLDGKKVLLEGEIAPGGDDARAKVSRFVICYSVAKCCVSSAPKVQHFVDCRTPPGKTVTNYFGQGQVRVLGTLHVKVVKDAGAISSVFQLDVERVDPIS